MLTQNPKSSSNTGDAPSPASSLVIGHWSFRPKAAAFTIIELVVVIGIMMILVAVTMPAIKSLTRNNSQAQAVNHARAMIANARSIAISRGRQAGIVFFEETALNASPLNNSQSAAQLIIEDGDQTKYSSLMPGNTVFVHYAAREYLPTGIRVAVLNDDTSKSIITGESSSSVKSRVILFNSSGQMILRNGIACDNLPSGAAGTPPKTYADWNIASPVGAASDGVSSPGLVIFNLNDYKEKNFTSSAVDQNAAAQWIQQHADILIINAYTGNIIR